MNPEDITNLILMGCDEADRAVTAALAIAPAVVTATVRTHPLTAFLPGAVQDHIIGIMVREINRAGEYIRDAIEAFRLLARSLGQPTVLRAAADTLGTNVTDATSSLTSSMVTSSLLGLSPEHWKSDATTHYHEGLNQQTRAADRIAEIVRDLQLTLNNMADSIETFYGDLRWSFIGVGIAAAGLAVTIYTAPTGVGPIIGLIITIIGVLQAVASIVLVFTAAGDRNASAAEALAGNPAIQWESSVFAG